MVPPVPIPNTVVKHLEAESTCMETCWEDRKLPVKKKSTEILNCTPKVGQKTTFGGAVFL